MEYYHVFNKEWFKKHQRKLIWLLNAPLIRIWFRWCLRIRKYDCEINERIVKIEPNCYTVFLKKRKRKIYLRTDFRTHNKFSKRLYYAFKPLWWAMHIWDWLVADRFIPKLSFGFLTLTAFPAAGENSPVDGFVRRNIAPAETYATIHDSAGTAFDDTGVDGYCQFARNGTDGAKFDGIIRFIHLFDTSSLGAGANISAATISLFGKSKDTAIAWTINIATCTPGSNSVLANSDYNIANWGGVTQATGITGANFSTTAYNDLTLNSTGRTNISKTGITKLGARFEDDINNVEPGGGAAQQATANFATADTAGTANDPKLVVTYTTGGASNLMLMGIT